MRSYYRAGEHGEVAEEGQLGGVLQHGQATEQLHDAPRCRGNAFTTSKTEELRASLLPPQSPLSGVACDV